MFLVVQAGGQILFVTAGFNPVLGPDEEKSKGVCRYRQIGIPTVICSAIDILQAASVSILTLTVIICFLFEKGLPALTYRTAKST